MPAPPKAFFEEQLGKSLTPAEYTNLLNKGGWSAEPVSTPAAAGPMSTPGPGQFPVEAPPPGIAAPTPANAPDPANYQWSPGLGGAVQKLGWASKVTNGMDPTAAALAVNPPTEDGGGALGGADTHANSGPQPMGPPGVPGVLKKTAGAGDVAPAVDGASGVKPGGVGGGGFGGGGSKGPPTQEQLEKMFMLPGEKEAWLKQIEYEKGQAEKSKQLMDLEITAAEKTTAEQLGATQAYAAAQAKQAEDEAQFQDWHSKEMAQLQADSDKAAAMKLDSNRMFRYQNTGDAVLGGVMMALGAIGGAMAQTTGATHDNPFVTSLNKAIERDLAQQQVEIEQAKSGVARKEGILAQRYKQYGDMKVAKNAAQLDAYKLAMVQINQKAAIMGTESAKVNAEKASAALQYQIDSKMAQHDLYLQAQWKQYQQAQAQAAAAAAYAQQQKAEEERKYWRGVEGDLLKKDGTKLVFDKSTGAPIGVIDPATGQLVSDGGGGGSNGSNKPQPVPLIMGFNAKGEPTYADAKAYNPESATKIKNANEAYEQAKQDVALLKALRKKHGGGAIWSPDDQAEADAASGRLILQVKELGKLGALSGPDMKLVEMQVPTDPLAVKPGAAILGQDPVGKKIDALDKGLDRMYGATIKAHTKAPASSKSAAPLKEAP